MEKIKAKINKLLRLAMSSNEHESKLAMEKAIELMAKHGLSKEEVLGEEVVYDSLKVEYVNIPSWLAILANRIGSISGCYIAFVKGKNRKVRNQTRRKLSKEAEVLISGEERDVKNVEYLLTFFYREIKKAKGNKHYKLGLVSGVTNRLAEVKSKFFSDKNALTITNIAKIEKGREFLSKKFRIKVSKDYSNVNVFEDDFKKGLSDSANINANNGVNEKPKELEWQM